MRHVIRTLDVPLVAMAVRISDTTPPVVNVRA
jgi:hypothetical protein